MASVYGVDLDTVDEDIIGKYIDEYELGDSENDDVKDMVKALAKYFRDKTKSDDVEACECGTCGGLSDLSLDECPYCGDAGIEEDEDNEEDDDLVVIEDDDEDDPQEEIDFDNLPEVEQGPPKKSKAKKKATKKKATKKKATKKSTKLAKRVEPTEIEIVEEDGSVVVWKEQDLNNAVKRIKKGETKTAQCLYEMGGEITAIMKDDLWKLRQDKKSGKSVYKNFRKFCSEELGMSHNQAYVLVNIYTKFSKESLEQFGVSKLKMALALPEEKREEFLDGAENESTSALSDKARGLKDSKGQTKAIKAPKGSVTAALVMGITELPMYKRPTSPGKFGQPTSPATSLKQDPWAVMDLENNVQLYIKLDQNDDDEIVAVVEVRRGVSEI